MLPKEKVKASTASPKKLVFYSAPKSGKTTALSMLEDNLLLDFEDGSDFVDALKIKIIGLSIPKDEAAEVKSKRESENKYYLGEVVKELREKGNPYRYLTVDTTTGLEAMLDGLALQLYQGTPMGKTFTGKVLTLPNGAGYLYFRMAFEKVIEMLEGCCERLILSGHLKERIVEVGGKEATSKDIDLTGKLKNIVCAKADAVAYLYRENNKVIMNFKTSEEITCGARPDHLRNQEIVISESDDSGKVTAYWDRIFVD